MTWTEYEPADRVLATLTESVELADAPEPKVTVAGFTETTGPPGDTDAERATAPVKLLMLDRVMVLVAEEPWVTVTKEGDAEIVKLGGGPDDVTVRDMVVL